MDEKTKLLISLGAATAANCIPCFEYLFEQGKALKLSSEEIQAAVEIAVKVKNGAHISIKNTINDIMGFGSHDGLHGCEAQDTPCCDQSASLTT